MKDLKKLLSTNLSKAGKTSPSYDKRIANIEWIKKLDRRSLSNSVLERRLLLHTTRHGEKVFIQYPGKESRTITKNNKQRKPSAIRPWDFRPQVYLPGKQQPVRDFTFGDVWAIIFHISENLIKNNNDKILRILSTVLYRIAYMHDHSMVEKTPTVYNDIKYNQEKTIISKDCSMNLSGLFLYSLDSYILGHIENECPDWGSMSFEAFLYLNELLTWNEDCKYYYRNYYVWPPEKQTWISNTGRVNTIRTHIRIIGYILNVVALSDIFNDFSNQKGVSPASDDEILKICKGYIHKQ